MNITPKKEVLLIVDDNEMNRDMLSLRFQKNSYLTESVESGAKALEYIEKSNVDAVLLDIMMPNMTGFEVLEKLRLSYSPIKLPIIVVTALEDSEDIVKALELGANDYLTKPINFPVALARVRTQLSHKRLQEALSESEERYALALRGANDGIWDWNLKTNTLYFSPHFEEMLGFDAGELGNDPENWFNLIHPSEAEKFKQALNAHFLGETPLFEFKHRLLNKEGFYLWMLTRGIAILDNKHNAIRMAGSQTDITKNTITDLITGLPNDILFLDRLELIIEHATRFNFQYAILLIEINRFNEICETYGLKFGDILLIEFTKRLKHCLRGYDTLSHQEEPSTISHLSGAKFSILLEKINNTNEIMRVIARIKDMLESPIATENESVSITFNTGIVLSE